MYAKSKKEKSSKFYKTIVEFGENTSFHGVKYAVSKDSTICEKIFWIIIVILGFCGAIYMTMIFWDRYNSNPIRITIQSLYKQTSLIPFPGVTICTAIRQVPNKVNDLLKTLKIPNNMTIDDVKELFPLLMSYTQPIKADSDKIHVLQTILGLNKELTVNKLFENIEPSCHEILLKCRWEQQVVPCDQLFKTSLTRDGHCCSFNTIVAKNSKKYRSLFYGAQMGLSVIINPMTANISKATVSTLSSTGIKILIHSPEDYPGLSSIEKQIGNGTETYIRILGTKLTSSESVRSLTAEQRNCLFDNERTLKYFPSYRDTNCNVECRMRKIFHYCKCIPFTFPKSNRPVCNLTDIICLEENYNLIYRENFVKNSQKNRKISTFTACDCPSQCNDVFYAVQSSSIPMTSNIPTISNFYTIENNPDVSDKTAVHIYFGSYYQTEMLRDTITSTYYLLSSFGGVFSLFLGCSFISVLEILYFFCYRLFTKYND